MVKRFTQQGIPLKPPALSVKVAKPTTPHDATVEASLKMPNERDESVDTAPDVSDPVMKQAAIDVKRGLQDTSKGTELNRVYKRLK